MAFKIKPILTPRQLRRAKWTTGFASLVLLCLGFMSQFGEAAKEDVGDIKWND